ncbi:hypothetical protein V2J09_012105 [Rumex salicifolius]
MTGSNPNLGVRPVANFKPSPWGDQFLHYIPITKAIEAQEELARELKVELQKEMLSINQKPILEQLRLIDAIKRLDISYHFEKEIEDALKCIYENPNTCTDNLYLTSLSFRILRQHGFKVSCDVFKGFVDSNGSITVEASNDIQGVLSLYEACHLSIHGEDILDKALLFTINKLKHFIQCDALSYTLKEQVSHALEMALHKRVMHLESLYYMKIYEQDPTQNKTLLRFAKICFNLLQSSHKVQLSDISRWWESIGLNAKLPIRDRVVECYVWGIALHEPKYSLGKKITTIASQIMTSIDDVYDAYGTIEELKLFTDAVERWDKSCLNQLPEEYRWVYETLILDPFEEMERELAAKGRSEYVNYARKELDRDRCHIPLIIVSYMKQYKVTYEEACKVLSQKAQDLWKDINEAMIYPIEVPMPLLKCMLHVARLVEYTYNGGVDSFTLLRF